MNPSLYMWGTYHHLIAPLHQDRMGLVRIDRYLNAGITGNPKHPRAVLAHAEKDALLGAIAHEIKAPRAPLSFTLDGRMFHRGDIQRVFSGKGSPAQIRTTLWLATRLSRATPDTIRDYCDKFVGLDCNGFVGNYWGGDGNTEIDYYDKGRRKDAKQIAVGDALIFFVRGSSTPFHIAVVEEAHLSLDGKRVGLTAVQSAGLEKGLEQIDFGEHTLETDNQKHLFYTRKGTQVVYFAEGPPKGSPNA